jgi:hypothetical protein
MLRISLSGALPHRPRPLTTDELNQVFGGCAAKNQWCAQDKDCCAGTPEKGMQYYGCVANFCSSYSPG